MRVLSAGEGYRYLLKSNAAGDTGRHLATSLTRYYSAAGTPPGFWLGNELLRDGGRLSPPALLGTIGREVDQKDGESASTITPSISMADSFAMAHQLHRAA